MVRILRFNQVLTRLVLSRYHPTAVSARMRLYDVNHHRCLTVASRVCFIINDIPFSLTNDSYQPVRDWVSNLFFLSETQVNSFDMRRKSSAQTKSSQGIIARTRCLRLYRTLQLTWRECADNDTVTTNNLVMNIITSLGNTQEVKSCTNILYLDNKRK